MAQYNNIHSKETISKLDIIGSYVVDLYYNRLYDQAISYKEDSNKSLTLCYKEVITKYIQSINKKEFYKVFVKGIQYFTSVSTKYQLSNSKLIDFFVLEFVPNDYISSLTVVQKNNILCMIIVNSIKIFTTKILENYLPLIIDQHIDSDNIIILQDSFLQIILQERKLSYNKFVKSEFQNNDGKVSGVVDKLQQSVKLNKSLLLVIKHKNEQINKLTTNYKTSITKMNTLQSNLSILINNNKKLEKYLNEQFTSCKLLQNDNNKLQNDNNKLQQQIKTYNQESKKVIVQNKETITNQEDFKIDTEDFNLDTMAFIVPEVEYK